MNNLYRPQHNRKSPEEKILAKIQYGLVVLAIGLLLALFLVVGLDRHEKQECITWEQWEEQYPLHYLTDWQIDQCLRHGIAFE